MVSFSFCPSDGEFEGDPETAKPLLLSLAYVPALLPARGPVRRLRRPPRAATSRSATAGRSPPRSAATPASPCCSAMPPRTAVARSTTPTSPPASASPHAPDELTQLSFSIPKPIGTPPRHRPARRCRRRSPSAGAEVQASMTDARVRARRLRQRQLHPQAARRHAAAAAVQRHLGYASGRGLILEGGVPSTSPSARPRAATGRAGTSQRTRRRRPGRAAARSTRRSRSAGAIGPVTVLEVALRLSRTASVPDGDDRRVRRRGRRLVQRHHRPGVLPPRPARPRLRARHQQADRRERNLRFFDARLAISPPLGIAVQVDTELVSGGGTIFHDPASGHLLRRARPAPRQAASRSRRSGWSPTKNADGTPGSSFIIIGTLEGLGLADRSGHRRRPRPAVRLRPHVRRERRARRAADGPAQVPAVPDRSGAPHRRDHAPARHVLPGAAGQHARRHPRQADVRAHQPAAPRPRLHHAVRQRACRPG